MQIGPIAKRFVALKLDARLLRAGSCGTQRGEFIRQYSGQATRTRREIVFHQNGFTITRITMPINTGSAGISLSQR